MFSNIQFTFNRRLWDLDGISKSLKHYRDAYSSLDEWVREMEAAQLKAQENKPEDSKALAELLNKQKVGKINFFTLLHKNSIHVDVYIQMQNVFFRSLLLKLNKNRAKSMSVRSTQSSTHLPLRFEFIH